MVEELGHKWVPMTDSGVTDSDPPTTTRLIARAITLIPLVAIIIMRSWSSRNESGPTPFLNIEIIREVPPSSSPVQLLALLLLGGVGIAAALLSRRQSFLRSEVGSSVSGALWSSLLVLPFFTQDLHSDPGRLIVALLLIAPFLLVPFPYPRAHLLVVGSLGLMWINSAVVVPIREALVRVEKPNIFIVLQEHYAATVMSALDLEQFGATYLPVGYGNLGLIAGSLRSLLPDWSLVGIVGFGHALFLALLLTGLVRLQVPGRAVSLFVIAVLSLPGDPFGARMGMATPNLSGLRHLVTMFGIVILIEFVVRKNGHVLLLGLLLGALGSLSLQSGVVLVAVSSTYIFLSSAHGGSMSLTSRRLAGHYAGVCSGFIVMQILSATILGAQREAVLQLADFFDGRSSLVQGLHLHAAVLFIVAALLLLAAIANEPLEPRAALVAALCAGAGVQWIPYATRMSVQKLPIVMSLLILAIAASLPREVERGGPDREGGSVPIGRLAAVAVAVLCVFGTTPDLGFSEPSSCAGRSDLSQGFCLQGDWVDELDMMRTAVAGSSPEGTVVLSSAPLMFREMGFNARYPYNRGVFASESWEDFAVDELRRTSVGTVFVQAPDSILGAFNPTATEAFLTIVEEAAVFELVRADSGWLRFERRGVVWVE